MRRTLTLQNFHSLQEAQRWKRRCSFPSTCHAEVPGKILFYQPWSGRARGSQELNPSPRAAEPNSRQSTTRGAGEASQKRGTTARSRDSAVHGWGEETAKRSREQKPRPWWKESGKDCDGSWAQMESSETPTRAVRRNAEVCLTGNIQDPTRLTWSKAPFQQEIGPGEANLDVSMIMSLCLSFQRSDQDSAVPARQCSQAPVHLQPCSSFQSNIGRLQIKHMLWSFSSLGVTQIILGSVQTVFGFFQAFTHEHNFHSLCMLILAKQLQTLKR